MAGLIYVVDDEKVIATTLSAILRGNGFDAIPFFNPVHALKAAETQCPDLLISDVTMPGMNGVDLGIRLKAICTACRILLFSGQAVTSNLLDEARTKGHDFELLTKPIHPTELLAAIRKSDPIAASV